MRSEWNKPSNDIRKEKNKELTNKLKEMQEVKQRKEMGGLND